MDKRDRVRLLIVQRELSHALGVARDAEKRAKRAACDLASALGRVNDWLFEDEADGSTE